MILIIDNGKSTEEISRLLRMKNDIIEPKKIKPDGNAYILSDGDIKHEKENVKLINSVRSPILGIGLGSLFIGSAFGAKIKKGKAEKNKIIKVKKSCPLLLDFKNVFKAECSCSHIIDVLPENLDIKASSAKYEYEVVQDLQNPLFGIHFNPTTMDTSRILRNFEKLVEIWEKYHK